MPSHFCFIATFVCTCMCVTPYVCLFVSLPAGNKPSLLELQSMRDVDFTEIRIMDEIAPRWDQVAIALEVDQLQINIISKDCAHDAQTACRRMLSWWIDSRKKVNWGFLVDALCRADLKVLAERVKGIKKIKIETV